MRIVQNRDCFPTLNLPHSPVDKDGELVTSDEQIMNLSQFDGLSVRLWLGFFRKSLWMNFRESFGSSRVGPWDKKQWIRFWADPYLNPGIYSTFNVKKLGGFSLICQNWIWVLWITPYCNILCIKDARKFFWKFFCGQPWVLSFVTVLCFLSQALKNIGAILRGAGLDYNHGN